MSGFFIIPIRKILPDEILEFIDWIYQVCDIDFVSELNFDKGGKLTDFVCEVCLGNFTVAIPIEERGHAALVQLKWGKDPAETG